MLKNFTKKKIKIGVVMLGLAGVGRVNAQTELATVGPPATSIRLPQLVEGGGDAAIVRAIQLGVRYPKQALRDAAQGQCLVTFAVAPSGQVCQIKMKYSVRADLDTAVVQAVRQLPHLQPAMQHGRPVACLMSAPVTFVISNPPRLPRHPLPGIDSVHVYTTVTYMPVYQGQPGFQQLSADLMVEYLRLSQGTGCFVPRYGTSVVMTVGPSGTLYDVRLLKDDKTEMAALEAQFGDQIAKQEPSEEEKELPEACVAQVAEAARHLPRLTPAYVDGQPVAMRLLLSIRMPRP
ncbi:energy transducer TonB [Hymenobacter caeli]|uniref:TonB family protein n=2 Tax=Hymenobacter caeli TaxID=2735894 RepID=A0ABX2FMZ5_9BACT|nr:TonB family protein [Hymenobacter caeli]